MNTRSTIRNPVYPTVIPNQSISTTSPPAPFNRNNCNHIDKYNNRYCPNCNPNVSFSPPSPRGPTPTDIITRFQSNIDSIIARVDRVIENNNNLITENNNLITENNLSIANIKQMETQVSQMIDSVTRNENLFSDNILRERIRNNSTQPILQHYSNCTHPEWVEWDVNNKCCIDCSAIFR